MGEVTRAPEILDRRDALFRECDEEVAERGGEDPVADGAVFDFGEARLQAGSRAQRRLHRLRRPSPEADGAVDGPVPLVLAPARRASVHVLAYPALSGGIGIAGGGRDEFRLDLGAGVSRLLHRMGSMWGSARPSKSRRILRKAWNT